MNKKILMTVAGTLILLGIVPFSAVASTPVNYILESGLPSGTTWQFLGNGTLHTTTRSTVYSAGGFSTVQVIAPAGYSAATKQVGNVLYVNFTLSNGQNPGQFYSELPYLVIMMVIGGITMVGAILMRRR